MSASSATPVAPESADSGTLDVSVVMPYLNEADADDSYDLAEAAEVRRRAPRGLCRCCIAAGATLMSSAMARTWFRAPSMTSTAGCAGFTKKHHRSLDQRCTRMEFATEMILKSSLYSASTAEVPITLRPDGREAHAPPLRTFRDGWRTLRFFLLYSRADGSCSPASGWWRPGCSGYAFALPRAHAFGALEHDAPDGARHGLTALGFQAVLSSFFASVLAMRRR